MTRIPVDSADAAELREQAAEQTAADQAERARPATAEREHDARCVGGWLGEDDEGRPRPCHHCRPRLADRRCSVCGQLASGCRADAGGCCDHCAHDTSEES